MNVSILIPTMNRSEYIDRALRYYAAVGFSGQVLIGDSSNEQHAQKITGTVNTLSDRLNVLYRTYPNPPYKGNAVVLKGLADLASTPYVIYAGDDDFLVPGTLERCAAFLDGHPDYSAAHGVSVAVGLKSAGPHAEVVQAYNIPGHVITSDSTCERWRGYIRHALSTQYYLHRGDAWRRMYRDVERVPMRYLGEEVLPCSFTTILGKVQELEGLSSVFQVNLIKEFGWGTHSMYSLMMEPGWSSAALALRELITAALAEGDQITPGAAQQVFDKEWWRHMLIMAQAHYDSRYGESNNYFSAFKKRYPVIVNAYRVLSLIHHGRFKHVTLRRLLDPANPLHKDFMPVYLAINQPTSGDH